MKIGIDIDGVIATFDDAFAKILTNLTGLTFPKDSDTWPTVWDWDEQVMQEAGFVKEKIKRVQREAWGIVTDPYTNFWYSLPIIEHNFRSVRTILECYRDVYFITSRPGPNALNQTREWFWRHLGYVPNINIIISSQKGDEAARLDLDIYIDDRAENILDVMEKSPKTKAYLLNRPYNQWASVPLRVDSVAQMVMREGL